MPRRLLALVLLLGVAFGTPTAAAARVGTRPLALRLAHALAVPRVSPARTGAVAVDLATGRVLYAHNSALPLVPASNEKLPLTYAALELLGPDFRIETDVLGEGSLVGSTWRGDLVLQGHGDPTLSTADLNVLARRIRSAGIARITGRIVGDESFFDSRRTAPGWKPSYYIDESPPLSALSVDRGRFHGGVSRVPPLGAAMAFREALQRAHVAAGAPTIGVAPADALQLAAVESPPLAALVRFMDRESDNFTAELLLKQLGAPDEGVGTTAAGAAAVRSVLAADGIPLGGVRIVDGSGLSRLDRLTPRALVALLRAAWANPEIRPSLVGALPVAGVSGTLDDRMQRAPARGNVAAKTGTTDIASALSGYVRRRFVFSVLQNGRPLCVWCARRAQDRFATVLAAE
jgi:D-alanyl-D-alanine carboxypeptidase/D-alanyl-D-alanine-endopeptidase (penicillin-binding protein 4)